MDCLKLSPVCFSTSVMCTISCAAHHRHPAVVREAAAIAATENIVIVTERAAIASIVTTDASTADDETSLTQHRYSFVTCIMYLYACIRLLFLYGRKGNHGKVFISGWICQYVSCLDAIGCAVLL